VRPEAGSTPSSYRAASPSSYYPTTPGTAYDLYGGDGVARRAGSPYASPRSSPGGAYGSDYELFGDGRGPAPRPAMPRGGGARPSPSTGATFQSPRSLPPPPQQPQQQFQQFQQAYYDYEYPYSPPVPAPYQGYPPPADAPPPPPQGAREGAYNRGYGRPGPYGYPPRDNTV